MNEQKPPNVLLTYQACRKRTEQVKKVIRNETIMTALDTLFLLSAFAGMACLCIPGAQPLAPLFIAPAVGYFTGKYSQQLISASQSVYSFFNSSAVFNKKNPSTLIESQINIVI
jgi:hypothetical protein